MIDMMNATERMQALIEELNTASALYYTLGESPLSDAQWDAKYNELLALGGDANLIPYFYDGERLIQGNDAVMAHLETLA